MGTTVKDWATDYDIFNPPEHTWARRLTVPPELEAKARLAEANCPERAIEIDE